MNIEVSVDFLQKFAISADDFVYLYLLHAKSYDVLEKLNLNADLNALQTKGLVKLGEDVRSHTVRSKFFDETVADFEQMWSELLSHFPLKVFSNQGIRVLRAKDPLAKNNEKARKQYRKYIKDDKAKHDYVVKCLQTELDVRRSGNNLAYMQQLSTWVNQRTWEKYADLTDTDTNERRQTRQL